MVFARKRAAYDPVDPKSAESLPSEIPEAQYKSIFDALPPMYLVLTPDFRMVAANHSRFRGTLSVPQEVIGKNVFEVFRDNPDDPKASGVTNLRASLERVLATRVPDRMAIQKYDIPRPNGGGFEERYWSPINMPVLNEAGEVQYIIHQVDDVTDMVRLQKKESEYTAFNEQLKHEIDERLNTQERLQKKQTELETEQDLRDKFVATVSHDLRNPITAAKISAQILLRRPDKTEEYGKNLIRILKNLERADHMIQDLLDANQIKAGQKLSVLASECDLKSFTSETLDELAVVHGNRFILQSPDSVRGYWGCEELRRVIENLCTNAVKYGSPNTPITVTLKAESERVLILVHNYGSFIPKEHQSSLFEAFRRAPNAQESGKRGWGLGLALVRGIAEAHDGYVEVKSSEKEGTTFTVCLPWDARK